MQRRSSLLTQAINSDATSPSQPPATASCSSEHVTSPPAGSGLRSYTSCMPASHHRQASCVIGGRSSPGGADPPLRGTIAHFARGSWEQSLTKTSTLHAQYLEDLQASSTPPGRPPSFIGVETSLNTQESSATRHRRRGSWESGTHPHNLVPQLLTGHCDAVLSLCLDSNGRMYSSSSDKTIRVRSSAAPPTVSTTIACDDSHQLTRICNLYGTTIV